MADREQVAAASDPLQDELDAAERLARISAGDDERHFLLTFHALVNLLDALTPSGSVDVSELTRAQLLRSAEPQVTRGRAGLRSAVGVDRVAASDSIYADPTFQSNARILIRERTRIVGGIDTRDYPDCVAVGAEDSWCCTGTLVAPNVVVTAGHCLRGGCAARVFVGEDVTSSGDGRMIDVESAVAHPAYQPPGPTHDLCVLILAQDADIAPRQLADRESLETAETVRLAGYGNTDVNSSGGYGRRRMVDVPLASTDPKYGADPESEFVAGAPFLDRDSCNGDSGGPAYLMTNGTWRLAGATSRATASTFRPCGDGGIYTRMDTHEDWIRSVPGGRWP